MGLILDSSVLVAAERQGQNARQMLASIARKIAETEVGISVVTLIELAHGAARANTPERKAQRQKFIEELLTAMPVHLVTVSLALRTGEIDGEYQARGIRIPLPDLLIGVTALELGYSVGTGQPSALPAGARPVRRAALTRELSFESPGIALYGRGEKQGSPRTT
jgi:predicted nucleic acid-binding protein